MLGGQLSTLASNLKNSKLSPRARLVLLSIATVCDRCGWGPPIPMKLESLGDRCGLSMHSIRRSLKELEYLIDVEKIKDEDNGRYLGVQFQVSPESFPTANLERQSGATTKKHAPIGSIACAKSDSLSLLYTPEREPQGRIPQEWMDKIRATISGERKCG